MCVHTYQYLPRTPTKHTKLTKPCTNHDTENRLNSLNSSFLDPWILHWCIVFPETRNEAFSKFSRFFVSWLVQGLVSLVCLVGVLCRGEWSQVWWVQVPGFCIGCPDTSSWIDLREWRSASLPSLTTTRSGNGRRQRAGAHSCREGRLEHRVSMSGESGQQALEGKRVWTHLLRRDSWRTKSSQRACKRIRYTHFRTATPLAPKVQCCMSESAHEGGPCEYVKLRNADSCKHASTLDLGARGWEVFVAHVLRTAWCTHCCHIVVVAIFRQPCNCSIPAMFTLEIGPIHPQGRGPALKPSSQRKEKMQNVKVHHYPTHLYENHGQWFNFSHISVIPPQFWNLIPKL